MPQEVSERAVRTRMAERRREKSTVIAPPGLIRDDETYTYDELLARVGLGAHWARKAEKEGLKTLKAGRVKLIRGRDVIEFLENRTAKKPRAKKQTA